MNNIINKCFNLCESVSNDTKLNIYGELYENIYNSKKNYIHYFPRNLVLQLTSNCNLRCKHCFFSEKTEKYDILNNLPDDKIFEQVKYFVEEVNILSCTITGGEIFSSIPFLFEIINYLKQHNISVKLITNGTLIGVDEAKKLGEILNPKYDIIQISLDGATKDVNDKIRGNGVFKKVINSLRLLADNNVNTEIGFTINSFNVSELSELYLLAKKFKVKKINYGRFTQEYESQIYLVPKIDDIFINLAKLADIYDSEVKLRLPCITIPDYLNYNCGKELLDNKLKNINEKNINLKCKPHDEQVTMFSDGSISLCYDCTINDVVLGNINKTPFEILWKERYKNPLFQKRENVNHACSKCQYLALCKAGCPYRAYIKHGTTLMPGYDCNYFDALDG